MFTDEYFMGQALKEAVKAFEADEVPVGAVVVMNNRIIGKGHNQTEKLTDSTAHAEILALTAAFHFLNSKYLPEATLFVTVEPCFMCSGALYWSKIGRVVYGAADPKNGYSSVADRKSPFHPKTIIQSGIQAEACADLMKKFFAEKRLLSEMRKK